MILIDMRRRIVSDANEPELHEFAVKALGLSKKDFGEDRKTKYPFYKLPINRRMSEVLRRGAKAITIQEADERAAGGKVPKITVAKHKSSPVRRSRRSTPTAIMKPEEPGLSQGVMG